MENLVIINRAPHAGDFKCADSNGVVWKTCLRQILFTTSDQIHHFADSGQIHDNDLVLSSTEALAFLTEVLCGLKSPVFGETEVFGQFKTFLDSVQSSDQALMFAQSKWVRFLLELVKNLRTKHIVGLGSNSYGSTLRKLTRDVSRLSIIGAGQLATEILPWISKNKTIQLLVRNPEKYIELEKKYDNVMVADLYTSMALEKALIVAAPIENKDLIQIMEQAEVLPEFIYDLRNSGFEELSHNLKNIRLLSLADFFEIFNADKIKFENLKIKISQIIQQRCADYAKRMEVRPLGWDDLCL